MRSSKVKHAVIPRFAATQLLGAGIYDKLMLVSELIDLLKSFPQDAELGKVCLSDDTGMSDSEMVKEDWGLAENVKDAQGNPSDKKLVFCSFGELEDED